MKLQGKNLLLLVAVIVLVVLAGVFFREEDQTQLANPSTSSATTTAGRSGTTPADTEIPSVDEDGMPTVALADLPAEAQEIHRLLMTTGPFEYSKDGSVFGNREGLLPDKPNGYYREFTIETPGSDDRGARRFVVGGCGQQTSSKPVRVTPCSTTHPIYYTDDHYASFKRVL